jgi:hypothetical protein
MNRITIAASILALSSSIALAQGAPATTPNAARPTPPAPAAAAPTAAPATQVSALAKGSAPTAAEARTAYQSLVSSREATCKARGLTFKWSPAHSVGDANPKGGFYAKPSQGSCREMTLKQARELNLVTVRQ